MSAAGKREELEARIHQLLTDTRQEGIEDCAMYIGTRLDIPHLATHLTGRADRRRGTAAAILAAADAYADEVASERVVNVTEETAARLTVAAAEAHRKAS